MANKSRLLSCLGGTDSLPPGQLPPSSNCGAPLQMLLGQPRVLQMCLSRSLGLASPSSSSSTFYLQSHLLAREQEEDEEGEEEDSFFEDMTALYRRQAVVFQQASDQVRESYLAPAAPCPGSSLFGEVAQEGGEQLYSSLLTCCLHPIGADFQYERRFQLIEHLRKAFQIDPCRHLELYSQASSLAPPPLHLSLGVLSARGLASKSVGGSANPYCLLQLAREGSEAQTTSCQTQTLAPIWEETFTLAVAEQGERVQVAVWSQEEGQVDRATRLRRFGEVRHISRLFIFLVIVIVVVMLHFILYSFLGQLVSWLVGCLVGLLFGFLAGELNGCLVGRLVELLVG